MRLYTRTRAHTHAHVNKIPPPPLPFHPTPPAPPLPSVRVPASYPCPCPCRSEPFPLRNVVQPARSCPVALCLPRNALVPATNMTYATNCSPKRCLPTRRLRLWPAGGRRLGQVSSRSCLHGNPRYTKPATRCVLRKPGVAGFGGCLSARSSKDTTPGNLSQTAPHPGEQELPASRPASNARLAPTDGLPQYTTIGARNFRGGKRRGSRR